MSSSTAIAEKSAAVSGAVKLASSSATEGEIVPKRTILGLDSPIQQIERLRKQDYYLKSAGLSVEQIPPIPEGCKDKILCLFIRPTYSTQLLPYYSRLINFKRGMSTVEPYSIKPEHLERLSKDIQPGIYWMKFDPFDNPCLSPREVWSGSENLGNLAGYELFCFLFFNPNFTINYSTSSFLTGGLKYTTKGGNTASTLAVRFKNSVDICPEDHVGFIYTPTFELLK